VPARARSDYRRSASPYGLGSATTVANPQPPSFQPARPARGGTLFNRRKWSTFQPVLTRAIGLTGLAAGAALVGSLFLTWYQVERFNVTNQGGGFFLRFGSGPSNAWDAISDTSLVLSVCAVAIGGLLIVRLVKGSRRAALAALGFGLIGVGLVTYRIVATPQARRGVEGSYFDRANGVPATDGVSQSSVMLTSGASGGAGLAVGAAVVATLAAGTLAIGRRPHR
jgi:hypothetical protein